MTRRGFLGGMAALLATPLGWLRPKRSEPVVSSHGNSNDLLEHSITEQRVGDYIYQEGRIRLKSDLLTNLIGKDPYYFQALIPDARRGFLRQSIQFEIDRFGRVLTFKTRDVKHRLFNS